MVSSTEAKEEISWEGEGELVLFPDKMVMWCPPQRQRRKSAWKEGRGGELVLFPDNIAMWCPPQRQKRKSAGGWGGGGGGGGGSWYCSQIK